MPIKAAPYRHQKLSTMTVDCNQETPIVTSVERVIVHPTHAQDSIADVLVPLNTIRLRDQPMAFDPVVPVMRHRAVFLSSLVELGRNAAH
jgi:hypothetical protein